MRQIVTKAEATRMLRSVGTSEELIREILDQLDDPIDSDRDAQTFERYGLNYERLTERMGGSP